MKKLIRHIICTIILFGNVLTGFSQLVSYSGFSLIQNEKEVFLYWVIDSGYTCNGISIWRSTDSINYAKVGEIIGVCGSSSSPIPYQFIDKTPVLNQTNYYKIRMGLNQFSYFKTIYVDYTHPGSLILKPNPANSFISFEINNDFYNNYSVSVFNKIGQRVYYEDNINENSKTINLEEFNNGVYYIAIIDINGKKLTEKFILAK